MQNQWLLFGASVLLLIIAVAGALLIPTLSMLLFPFLTALYTFVKQNGKPVISIVLVVLSAISLFVLTASYIYTILFSLLPFVTGMIIAVKTEKETRETQLLLIAGCGVCIFIVGTFYSIGNTINADTINIVFDVAKNTFSKSIEQVTDPALAEEMNLMFSYAIEETKKLLPYLLFTISATLGYIALWFITGLNFLFRTDKKFVPYFSTFKCNTTTVFIMAITAIISLFVKEGVTSIALDNIFAIFNFMLTICAISLIDFWMKRKNWFILVRILIIASLIIAQSSPILSLLLSILAFLDARANFRRLN